MLKLVEIVGESSYDESKESIIESFLLREIFINPDYIITLRENVSLRNKSIKSPIVKGLNNNVFFTELKYSEGKTNGPKTINVVGRPLDIIQKYSER